MTNSSQSSTAPLEDLMVAMDVVDTLRHRDQLVDREMDSEARRARLIDKLREIYTAQGITVSDAMLAEGVKALEEDRFAYTPPSPGFSTRLAILYVKRERWLKPLLFLFLLLAVLWAFYYAMVLRPEGQLQAEIPAALESNYQDVTVLARENDVQVRAESLLKQGQVAVKNGRLDEAQAVADELAAISDHLGVSYSIRVVNRPNTRSGVWRLPDVNSNARNYYLVVEAINSSGKVVSVPVLNEETGQQSVVTQWGIRVDKVTFDRIGADKQDDGIIQAGSVGKKSSGFMGNEYSIDTSGAAITAW